MKVYSLIMNSTLEANEIYFIGVVPETETTQILNNLSYGIMIFIGLSMIIIGFIYNKKKSSNGVTALKIVTPLVIISLSSILYINLFAITNEQDEFANKLVEESNINFKAEVKEKYNLDVLGNDFFFKSKERSGKNNVVSIRAKDDLIMVRDREGNTIEAKVYLSQDNSSITIETKTEIKSKKIKR